MTTIKGWMLLLALGLIGSLGSAGCGGGGGDDDDDSGGSCQAAGRAICDAACACRDGDACGVGEGLTLGFDNQADCEAFWVNLGCSGGGDATIDYAACETAMGSAECTGEGEDAATVLPAECQSTEDTGA